jgi:site-specific DNA recombinase
VRRQQPAVDALVTRLVCERLASPDAMAVFAEDPGKNRESLLEEAQSLRAKLDLAADQFAEDAIDVDQLRRITTKVRGRLTKLESELGGRSGRTGLVDLATGDIAKRWDSVPIERRRAVIRLLVEVRILPRRSAKAPYAFDPSTVEVNWRATA